MERREQEKLVESLIERLRTEGVPKGTWLVEIAQAREALRGADDLLRRLSDALVRSAGKNGLAAIIAYCVPL